jgi:DeoR/GlpR family transcriptional regulator of sugar metabolism
MKEQARRHFIEERHAVILKLVKERQRVTVQELCERFSVSVATVRADLTELEEMGRIRRTHGGAIPADREAPPVPFGTRRMLYGAEKRSIARAAAGLVKDGEVIFIDGGTTAAEMPRFLVDRINITVITPSIEVASWLHTATPISVYLLNGFLNRDSLSTIGVPSEDSILQMNIVRAYCGAAGFTVGDGLTDVHMGFVEQKRVICRHARQVIGIVDHSKIGVTSLATFASLDDTDAIITDRAIPEDMRAELDAHGVQVIIA